MTLIGNMGRWHGHESEEDLRQAEREAQRTVARLTQEIADRRALLSAHREHVARIQRQIAKREQSHD